MNTTPMCPTRTDPMGAHRAVRAHTLTSAQALHARIERHLQSDPSTPVHWGHVGDLQRLQAQLHQMHELLDRLGA